MICKTENHGHTNELRPPNSIFKNVIMQNKCNHHKCNRCNHFQFVENAETYSGEKAMIFRKF